MGRVCQDRYVNGTRANFFIRSTIELGASWFVSPALAGIISLAVFFLIRKFILESVSG